MLVADHASEAKADATLRRISRSRQNKTGWSEQVGIAKEQPVEFRADGKKQNIARLFEPYSSDCRDRTISFIEPTNSSNRIKKESQVFAPGCQAGNLHRLHRNFEGPAPIGDIVCACPIPSRTSDS